MKTERVLFLGLLASTVAIGCIGYLLLVRGESVLRSETECWSWGEVWQGESCSHEFTFENPSNEMLVVDRVLESCGCVECTIVGGNVVPPGSTKNFRVSIDTSKIREGEKQVSATVFFENARVPPFRMLLTGVVTAPFAVHPATTTTLRGPYWRPKRIEIILEQRWDAATLINITSEKRVFQVQWVLARGNRVHCTLECRPVAASATILDAMCIRYSCRGEERVQRVAVRVEHEDVVRITPTLCSLRWEPATERTKTISLQFAGVEVMPTSVPVVSAQPGRHLETKVERKGSLGFLIHVSLGRKPRKSGLEHVAIATKPGTREHIVRVLIVE